MKAKDFAKLLIPPLLFQLCRAIKNLRLFYSTIDKHKKISDTIFILGNGPSIKKQLEDKCAILQSAPCICVNAFASDEYYIKVKPSVYVIVDPLLFSLNDFNKDRYIEMWNALLNKTAWPMDIVFPSQQKDNEWVNRLKENHNIHVLFTNMHDCAVSLTKESKFRLFNKNKLTPPAQSVIATALYLAVYWKYKNILLLGIDSTGVKDIEVDQKTNLIEYKYEHFYDVKIRTEYNDIDCTIPCKLHEELLLWEILFESYWMLREYADFNNVSIFNASGYSWVDAFTRRLLDDFGKIA